jgi:hypothetical protein
MEQSAIDLTANTRFFFSIFSRFLCSVRDFDTAEHFETAPELVGRKFNRPRVQDLEAGPVLHGTTDRKSLKVRACSWLWEKWGYPLSLCFHFLILHLW